MYSGSDRGCGYGGLIVILSFFQNSYERRMIREAKKTAAKMYSFFGDGLDQYLFGMRMILIY
jgi:hypothetical protein